MKEKGLRVEQESKDLLKAKKDEKEREKWTGDQRQSLNYVLGLMEWRLEIVRGHNFPRASPENLRAPTPNTLRRSETPYVPPHRRRSRNPSPSLPPR